MLEFKDTFFGMLMGTASSLVIATVADAQQAQDNVVGGFTTGLVVSEKFNDNIYSTRNDKVSDTISIVAPSIDFTKESKAFDLSLGASAEIGHYKVVSDKPCK